MVNDILLAAVNVTQQHVYKQKNYKPCKKRKYLAENESGFK